MYSIDSLQSALSGIGYIADRALATSVYLALQLQKPLILEGEPGVGKTQLARDLSGILDARLIRLQCFDGIDSYTALYEWNYPKQLLDLKIHEIREGNTEGAALDIFTEEYLLERPLLAAIRCPENAVPPVLLIDEVDRADEEFEAFLLEVLSDFQISIPELGTVKAKLRPLVLLTSNRTRELHGALKRRCLYHWIDYPDSEREIEILRARVPGIDRRLAACVCQFVDSVRADAFYKKPGISETIDWAESLMALGVKDLEPAMVSATAGCLFKYKKDVDVFSINKIEQLLERLESTMGAPGSPGD